MKTASVTNETAERKNKFKGFADFQEIQYELGTSIPKGLLSFNVLGGNYQ